MLLVTLRNLKQMFRPWSSAGDCFGAFVFPPRSPLVYRQTESRFHRVHTIEFRQGVILCVMELEVNGLGLRCFDSYFKITLGFFKGSVRESLLFFNSVDSLYFCSIHIILSYFLPITVTLTQLNKFFWMWDTHKFTRT